jgi:hypothetical protein
MRNYKQFFAICKAHGFDKEEKVLEFTEGRTSSLSELSDREFGKMMLILQKLNAPNRQGRQFEPKPGDKQRKKLLALARKMNWGDVPTTLAKLDEWSRKQKYKKGLMDHTPGELDLLVVIFEQRVYADYLTALNR